MKRFDDALASYDSNHPVATALRFVAAGI